MSSYYVLKVKKDYASAIIEDLQQMDAVELIHQDDTSIPEWQKELAFARQKEMREHPEKSIDWDTAMKRLDELSK